MLPWAACGQLTRDEGRTVPWAVDVTSPVFETTYAVMAKCLEVDPRARPTVEGLLATLQAAQYRAGGASA